MDILLAIRAIRVRMPHCELKWEIPIDNELHWRAGLQRAEVRLFRLGTDGLPDWVETQRLERGIEFLVVCNSRHGEIINSWGKDGCEKFEQIIVTGLPSGWLLFYGKNAIYSCPNIDILTLSTTVRLQLKDGMTCPPKRSPVIMLVWKDEKGGINGQKELHSGTDHQQIEGS